MTNPIAEAKPSAAPLKLALGMAIATQASIAFWVLGASAATFAATLLLAGATWFGLGRVLLRPRYLRAFDDRLEGCAGEAPFSLPYAQIARLAFDGGRLFFFLKDGSRVAAPTGGTYDAPYRAICEKVLDNPGPPPYFDLES